MIGMHHYWPWYGYGYGGYGYGWPSWGSGWYGGYPGYGYLSAGVAGLVCHPTYSYWHVPWQLVGWIPVLYY